MLKSKIKLKGDLGRIRGKLANLTKTTSKPAPSVKIGLPMGSNDYPDGTSVIMVGTVHEFGNASIGVPERSFLRSTIHENGPLLKRDMIKVGDRILKGEITSEKGMEIMGMRVTSMVKSKIGNGISPPLQHREGTPLWDTGHLIKSITYEVKSK